MHTGNQRKSSITLHYKTENNTKHQQKTNEQTKSTNKLNRILKYPPTQTITVVQEPSEQFIPPPYSDA
jgi:hypothetical protein